MRKISTFLLSLLCLMGLTAQAQTSYTFKVSPAPTDGEFASSTHWYYIMNKGGSNGGYQKVWLSAGDGYLSSEQLTLSNSTQPTDEYGWWCVVGNETDGYKFYNKGKGASYVLGMSTSGNDTSSGAKMVEASSTDATYGVTDFDIHASYCSDDTYWVPAAHGTNRAWNQQSGRLVFWDSDQAWIGWGYNYKGDDGSAFKFTAANAVSYTVTVNYTVDGEVVETKTLSVEEGVVATISAPSNSLLTAGTPDKTDAVTGDCTITVPCTVTLPFTVSPEPADGAFAADTKWYAIKIKYNNWFQAHDDYSVTGHYLSLGASKDGSAADVLSGDDYLWCVTGSFASGYKFYNKKAGTGYTLNRASLGNDGVASLSADGTNNVFSVYPSGYNATKTACFAVKGDEGKVYINVQGDLSTDGSLLGWTDNDAGSAIEFMEPIEAKASLVLAWAASYKDYTAPTASTDLPEGAITVGNSFLEDSEKLAAYKEAYDALNTEKSETNLNALIAYNEQVDKGSHGLEEGAYYRLKCAATKYSSGHDMLSWDSNAPTQYAACVTSDDAKTQAATVWQFVKSGSGYLLKNVNTGKYLEPIVNASNKRLQLVDETSAGTVNVEQRSAAAGHFMIKNTNYTTANHHALFAEDGSADNYRLSVWDNLEKGADWFIVKATELEVALNTVGEASYASVYLPFGVKSGSDATLYTGELSGNVLSMTSKDGVAKETGVVIVGAKDAAAVTLTIGDGAEAVTGNALTGTLTPMTSGLDAYYVFSKGDISGEIGFYPHSSSLTTIRANKALLPAPTSGEEMVTLSFNGSFTAISAAALNGTAAASAPVYDLSGRRVTAPAKGGVYIQAGRKYIVK